VGSGFRTEDGDVTVMDFISAGNTRGTLEQIIGPIGLQFEEVRTDFVVNVFSGDFRLR
jgi:hypothetical protein